MTSIKPPTSTDLAATRTALGGKVALWAGPEPDGKAIGAVQSVDVEVDSANGRGIRGQVLELTYGAGGVGPPRGDSIVLTQMRADDPARSHLDEASTTQPGFTDLNSGIAGSDQNRFHSLTASLRHGGFLVQIQGADRDLCCGPPVRYGRSRRALISAAAADHLEAPQKLSVVRLAH